MPHLNRSWAPMLLFFAFLFLQPFSPSSSEAEDEETDRLRQKVAELEEQIRILEAHLTEAREQQILSPNGWQNKKNWRRLEVGMGKKEVLEILGQPIRVIGGIQTLWYYPNIYCGYCSFDETGKLKAWAEP